MPGRRKEKIKTKKERKAELESKKERKAELVELESKNFDYIRFAYDVLRYSAKKFGIQEHCLAVWDCPANDYGGEDNFLSLTRNVISKQIPFRSVFHEWIQERFEKNKFASFKDICEVLQLCNEKFNEMETIVSKVEASLSFACELIIFLYSENRNLYLKELAECWFECYFKGERKRFEQAGGIYRMRESGRTARDFWPDNYINSFIINHCLDYKTSKLMENLDIAFIEYCEDFGGYNPGQEGYIPPIDINTCLLKIAFNDMLLLKSKPEQASSLNLPTNTGLGIATHDEVLRAYGPSIASSQNPPESSSEVRPRHSRGLSAQERRRNMEYRSRQTSDQDTGQSGLDSSETIQSSERTPSVSGAKDATPNYNRLGARPKEPRKDSTEASSSQTGMASLLSSVEQDLGQLSLDSQETKQSGEEEPNVLAVTDQTSSQNQPSASHQEPRQEHRGSASQKKKKKKSKKNKQSN